MRLMFERCQKKVSAHLERKRCLKVKDITEISNPQSTSINKPISSIDLAES